MSSSKDGAWERYFLLSIMLFKNMRTIYPNQLHHLFWLPRSPDSGLVLNGIYILIFCFVLSFLIVVFSFLYLHSDNFSELKISIFFYFTYIVPLRRNEITFKILSLIIFTYWIIP